MADNSKSPLGRVPVPIQTHDEEKEEKEESQAAEKSSEGKQEFTDWAAI